MLMGIKDWLNGITLNTVHVAHRFTNSTYFYYDNRFILLPLPPFLGAEYLLDFLEEYEQVWEYVPKCLRVWGRSALGNTFIQVTIIRKAELYFDIY